uniref:Uncharacterized protein n=1 Tax=Oryza brachyantha TaxID=4533 RepID=J3MC83_ORYBR
MVTVYLAASSGVRVERTSRRPHKDKERQEGTTTTFDGVLSRWGLATCRWVVIQMGFEDKVEAAATAEEDEEDGDVAGEEAGPWPVEALPEPPDDAGPVGWPMPEFCPLTIDGAVKESFLEALRKDAEEQALRDAEARSPESRPPEAWPSSSKRQRAGTASPPQPSSSRSPYRNILQVFQQCKQDVA